MSKRDAYKTCELSRACYNQQKETYDSIFNHVDCFNTECLMRTDCEACKKYLLEESERKYREWEKKYKAEHEKLSK